jgi:hypothetical protein
MEKLLCRASNSGPIEDNAEAFAVLSRRLALEFDTTGTGGVAKRNIEDNKMKQVEKYMRVCLGVLDGFETIVTAAASEPILSIAAGHIMNAVDFSNFNSCRKLSTILEWPGMSKGERGELIVSLIVINTLDSLMFHNHELRSPVVSITSFFKALFASGIYEEQIRDATPSRLHQACDDTAFQKAFADANFYITHFFKVLDSEVLSLEFLMYCAVRGVAVVCANGQPGVDLALPIVFGQQLKVDKMSVLLIQSRNVCKYPNVPKIHLFDAMNPFPLGVLSSETKNPNPIIRMVFSLDAPAPIIHVMKRGTRLPTPREVKPIRTHAYSSYDIWCGPASSSVFGTIQDADNPVYKQLLQQTTPVRGLFVSEGGDLGRLLRSMLPCATTEPDHWRYVRIEPSAGADLREQVGVEPDAPDEYLDSEHGTDGEEFVKGMFVVCFPLFLLSQIRTKLW